jgi:hypothetical protein
MCLPQTSAFFVLVCSLISSCIFKSAVT